MLGTAQKSLASNVLLEPRMLPNTRLGHNLGGEPKGAERSCHYFSLLLLACFPPAKD